MAAFVQHAFPGPLLALSGSADGGFYAPVAPTLKRPFGKFFCSAVCISDSPARSKSSTMYWCELKGVGVGWVGLKWGGVGWGGSVL